ncbi:MAG: hypothetical protein ACLFVJ_07330 [Persicimonas sp.]
MPRRLKALVRWPKRVRGVDRVWWKPYTVHTAPVRWLKRQPAQVYAPVDKFTGEVAKAPVTKLKAECKRAGLPIDGDVDALRARLFDLVGETYEPEPAEDGDEGDVQARIRKALDEGDYNDMRGLWAELSDESIGRPTKQECVDALTAMLEADDGDQT